MKLDAETMSFISTCCKAAEELGYLVEKPLTDSEEVIVVSEGSDMAITINNQYCVVVILNEDKYRSPAKRQEVEKGLKRAFMKALQVDACSMDMVVLLAGENRQNVIENWQPTGGLPAVRHAKSFVKKKRSK